MPQLPAEDHECRGERPTCGVGVDVLGDRPVHLDDVGTETEDVAEGGVPRAGVVDGESNAACSDHAELLLGPLVVGDASVLGDLDDDPLGWYAAADEDVGQAFVQQGRR